MHCTLFTNRLYNFYKNASGIDLDLDPDYAKTLISICPNGDDPNKLLEMDPRSKTNFDTNYFKIVKRHGLYQ